MSDDPSIRGPQDGKLISLDEEHEDRYWTNALGVTKEELEKAIAAVGHSAAKVREYLGKSSQ